MYMMNGLPFSILVVDDDADDRMLIDEAFMEIGYAAEVKKFIDGKSLLYYLEVIEPSLYPSLIVLDNTLPALEALDILAILKGNSSYQHIPVVIYTTLLTSNKKEQLLASGAYACYEKGSSMQEIVQVVKELKNLAESNINDNGNTI
jgi:CheY-like chemotaxis protein